MPLRKGKIVLVLFQYYSDIRDFSVVCSGVLLIGPSLAVLGTACFLGTAQIPLPCQNGQSAPNAGETNCSSWPQSQSNT